MIKNILVTGANGQLGRCVQQIAKQQPELSITFVDKSQLDITDLKDIRNFFEKNNFTHVLNTAAYTQVDAAEEEQEKAFKINTIGAENLAKVCLTHDIELLHISTDYVFDGQAKLAYSEYSKTNPINIYGASKLAGEQAILEISKKSIILRTSWLYSPYGHNFYLSIERAIKQGKTLYITTEQVGTPTNALELAKVLLQIIQQEKKDYGIYHYSDLGEATWYDFAMAIEHKILGKNKGLIQPTSYYPTRAKRPAYSVLNHNKIKNNFNIQPNCWQNNLLKI